MSRRDDPTREMLSLAVARRLLAALIRVLFRVRMSGLEHLPTSGPVLLAGNHTGFLDGPFVFMLLPRPAFFLVKHEMFDSPFRPLLTFARQIPIRRGSPDRAGLRRALAVLDGGGVLAMFPEGTRGEGTLETIQHGIGYLALRAGCPVVPVVCRGTADALPKGRVLPRWRTPIDLAFGPAFRVEVAGDPRARSTMAAAAEEIRLRLIDHLESVPGEAA